MNKDLKFHSKDEIIGYIYNYKEKENLEESDIIWIGKAFLASVDNLKKNALPVEIEDFGEHFEIEEIKNIIEFLGKFIENK